MIVLNFAHPLTPEQLQQIEALTGQAITELIELDSQINPDRPLVAQVVKLVDQVGLSPGMWQTAPLVVNPPSLNYIALALIAELHGRCGYFLPTTRLRPVPGSLPLRYEVAEIINLQMVRDKARTKRKPND